MKITKRTKQELELTMSQTTTIRQTLPYSFFFAGHALFTVQNPAGEHYTFRIQKVANEGRDPIWFASYLTGPDNEGDYTYLGVASRDGSVRLTRASKLNDDSLPVKVLRWLLRTLAVGKALPEGYLARHEGYCGRCGRTLTTPESLDRGIGPKCWEAMESGSNETD